MSTESAIAFLSSGTAETSHWTRRVVGRFFAHVRTRYPWYDLPKPLGIAMLLLTRESLRRNNLYSAPGMLANPSRPTPAEHRFASERTLDGSWNDLDRPTAGMAGAPFARNFAPEHTRPEQANILDPNPNRVSEQLMKRDGIVPAKDGNALIAAWIQFMIHDWVRHQSGTTSKPWRIPSAAADGSSRDSASTVTRLDPAEMVPDAAAGGRGASQPVFANRMTHWWDGSQIYGTAEAPAPTRNGRLLLGDDPEAAIAEMERNQRGPLSEPGFWLGLGMFDVLFAREHNSIAEMLAENYPNLDDNTVFARARSINTALLAKIHTTEWTPAVTAHPTAVAGILANWYGLLGKGMSARRNRLRDRGVVPSWLLRSPLLFGIPGSRRNDHGIPFALTEEFAAVYRMHQLVPDHFDFRRARDGRAIAGLPSDFAGLTGRAGADAIRSHDLADLFYTFGTTHPGLVTLHNYPDGLRDLRCTIADGTEVSMDLAAIDILRCRELGIPRYAEFRRLLGLRVPKTFRDVTSNETWAAELADVYGSIDRLDLLTGMFAEDRPDGFAFSDTAFHIFILMASRRISCDRFLTDGYTAEVYTRAGLRWVEDNTMKDVLLRHLPTLAPHLGPLDNAFGYWGRADV